MERGNEKPTNFPGRPTMIFPNQPQNLTAFTSSVHVVGSGLGASGISQTTAPQSSSSPFAGQQTSIYGPTNFNGPSNFPPSSAYSKNPGIFQQTQVPGFPTTPTTPHAFPLRSPVMAPSVVSPPVSLQPQTQNSSVPIPRPFLQTPLSGHYNVAPRGNMLPPPSELQYSVARPVSQPPLAAFPATNIPPINSPFHTQPGGYLPPPPLVNSPFHTQQGGYVPPPPPVNSPFHTQQGGYVPPPPPVNSPFHTQQGGYVPPPPPIGVPLGFNSREQLQLPNAGPPMGGTMQSLVEDFQSLAVAPAPGSLDTGLDSNSLPRPLDIEDEQDFVPDPYPLNCHPRFFRLTTRAMPSSQSLLARWHLPLGVVVHPLAEAPNGEEVPIVNFGQAGVIRCRRCRTYVNPYVTFTDGGRKWRCNLCALLNDVPGEYFCPLDASGRRCDVDQRPELSKGSVEFVAPEEYMVRPPMPPVYFFLIDVSVSAVQSGLLEVIAKAAKSCLDELAGFPRTQIGFLTFDSALHFYNLKSSLTQPQMIVVTDVDDIFLPLPDDLLVNLFDSRNVVDAFLDSLPGMFQNNPNVESAFGPALKAAFMVMSQLGGKLLVFQSTLPSLGVGRLRSRGDDLRMYGTDKEHTLRIPEDSFYKQMAAEFTKYQIAVDIYAFSDKYSDIASLGSIAKYTGGQVYHFPYFRAAVHEEKFRYELSRDLTRETAWESVIRIRCGKGLRFTTYHGHFMLRSTDLLALPAVDCDKVVAVQLSLEETLMTTQTVYFQVALLYTSSSGERRIRVHTTAANVVTDLGEMYRQADTGAIVSLLSRLAIENTMSNKLEDARQLMQLKLVKSLKEYRNLFAVQHRLGGRLIFPESLKFLALYILALNKSVAIRGGYTDSPLDERSAAGYSMNILPVKRMLKYLYPSLFRVDRDLIKGANDFEESSKKLPLTANSLDPSGMYILDDGFSFVIWIGGMLSSNIVDNVLGNDLSRSPDLSQASLGELDNEVSRKLVRILKRLREKDSSYYQLCHIVRQGEQLREGSLLLSKLIEDQTAGASSYADWVLQIYRQSQST